MTTKLAGKDTFFLPFNLGKEDGVAGNPQAAAEDSYATSYLWERLFNKDAWLKVIGRFMHFPVEEKENFDGRTQQKKETLIFPRYHQWDVVNQLIDTTRREGPGSKYTIQHSAGSGKSNSIAWTAHQLSSLYADDGSKLFNSIVVVTDRTVLDSHCRTPFGSLSMPMAWYALLPEMSATRVSRSSWPKRCKNRFGLSS